MAGVIMPMPEWQSPNHAWHQLGPNWARTNWAGRQMAFHGAQDIGMSRSQTIPRPRSD